MKIAVAGGHMAPALGFLHAVSPKDTIIYIGRAHSFEGDTGVSLEKQVITHMGIPFIALSSGRIQRKLSIHTIPSILRIPKGFFNAIKILAKGKPDVVVVFGGYVSVPIGFAAKFYGIPLVLHESTLGAGLANKLLANFATKICISWESSEKFFPKGKTVLTGVPMLPFNTPMKNVPLPQSKENLPFIVVSGGSAGSHTINVLIQKSIKQLLSFAKVLHLTGDARQYNDFARLQELREKLPKTMQDRYSMVKFVAPDYINSVFAKADLVVGRSGFNTIMTMLFLQKKMLCIPLQVGQKNEQLENAKMLVAKGLGDILSQEASESLFLEKIHALLQKKVLKKKEHVAVMQNGGEKLYNEVVLCTQTFRKED